ncbi:fumarylacetoacetate hydrolase [Aspergillus sclerotialis]|uniref:Fumarylacetoacetate hydrolase n=1 Tax=Aspergillus sclerotialis TaxID=2070753 RepID=A0A3A2ZSG7_9EURO|nr:fumarylacetoacetate hydrolase [Aspergillus sclerotialis]
MSPLTNYIAFVHPELGVPRIGHLNWDNETIQPLAFASGAPLENLYQVIAAGKNRIKAAEDLIKLETVRILPPISGRDILAVGKNFAEHAAEFNKSGYDSSDKVTSRLILSSLPSTLDYEGELGVIIGKGGLGIKKEDASAHIWGYTIINDVTARERQRDHKQFFIGKSGDTYCPMGPVAVPVTDLPEVLTVQTFVNDQQRQKATTNDLMFSIPTLVETISAGMTLQPGDVIATGTPAGVGFGQEPPVFLKPGDEVKVAITGLGVLANTVIEPDPSISLAAPPSDLELPKSNASKAVTGGCLTTMNGKSIYYKSLGKGKNSVVFVHGLGGSMEFFLPFIKSLGLKDSHQLHLADLEGHGLSPTSPLSSVTIESLAEDLAGIVELASLSPGLETTLVAHSMGCLVAMRFAIQHPEKVHKLILIGPPPNSLPDPAVAAFNERAALVRKKGMHAVVDDVATAGTSETTKSTIGLTAVRLSLLATEPESYAKACTALAACPQLPVESIRCQALIITGAEDKVSPPDLCKKYSERIPQCLPPVVLDGVGHWHTFENVRGVSSAINGFI